MAGELALASLASRKTSQSDVYIVLIVAGVAVFLLYFLEDFIKNIGKTTTTIAGDLVSGSLSTVKTAAQGVITLPWAALDPVPAYTPETVKNALVDAGFSKVWSNGSRSYALTTDSKGVSTTYAWNDKDVASMQPYQKLGIALDRYVPGTWLTRLVLG